MLQKRNKRKSLSCKNVRVKLAQRVKMSARKKVFCEYINEDIVASALVMMQGHEAEVLSMAFSPNGTRLASICQE